MQQIFLNKKINDSIINFIHAYPNRFGLEDCALCITGAHVDGVSHTPFFYTGQKLQ